MLLFIGRHRFFVEQAVDERSHFAFKKLTDIRIFKTGDKLSPLDFIPDFAKRVTPLFGFFVLFFLKIFIVQKFKNERFFFFRVLRLFFEVIEFGLQQAVAVTNHGELVPQ